MRVLGCWKHGKVCQKTYPNPVKLREAFREAFTLTLGCSWPWGAAQAATLVIFSEPGASWVSLGQTFGKLG